MANIMQADGLMEKLTILSDAAKYDVACTSSGVQRDGDGKHTGNTSACGICHTFAGDGRCISLLKILLTNECIYDCKYCVNRVSNDVKRALYFITCKGRMLYRTRMEKEYITRQLVYEERPAQLLMSDGSTRPCQQLSLFESNGCYTALQCSS